MASVLHIIEHLDKGGGTRAAITTAKTSSALGNFEHSIVALQKAEPEALKLAFDAGIETHVAPTPESLNALIEAADIVHVEYWNAPAVNDFLHGSFPDMRLAMWCHIAGNTMPQIITHAAGRMADVCIACTPTTFEEHPVFNTLLPNEPSERNTMVIAPADFGRLENIQLRKHERFNVGYIGTVNFVKMHPDFVPMSAAIEVPDIQFIICGNGIQDQLAAQAQSLHADDRFSFRGFVEDIAGVIETLDVYGYPLCHDTYAAAELNLQEAMYAGVPPVVFPHGGIKGLIKHNETGLIVHSQEDYKRSIEFLYHNPEERKRIGLNASIYAKTHFGARNAAANINKVYHYLLSLPKRNHAWNHSPYLSAEPSPATVNPSAAQLFVDSLCEYGAAFDTSLDGNTVEKQIEADRTIAASSYLTYSTGIFRYAQYDQTDPFLRMWNGLYLEESGAVSNAVLEYAASIEAGMQDWRVQWYLARSLQKAGKEEESRRIYTSLRQTNPAFDQITGDLQFAENNKRSIQFSIPPLQNKHLEQVEAENPIRVSAIVSTYASETFIDGCLHNLVSQSLFQAGQLEIVVIDANSPENEKAVIERYQQNFDNILYVRTPARETLYASWNRGIKMARGQYITNANTDDRHKKDALEKLASCLDAHPELALLYPGQIDTPVPNESFETTSSSELLNWPVYSYEELERHCIIGSQPMWRKSLHEEYGYFRAEMESAGDYEFWLRIGKNENLYRYPETLGLYYRNPEGIEHGSQTSEKETLQIWHEYGMFERGIPVILRGRLITQAQVPQFTSPIDTQLKQRPAFDAYISQFEEALQQQNLDHAMSLAHASIQDYGELPYPMILKAIVHRQNMEYVQALEAIEQSIQIDETPEALIEMIQLSMATGQEEEAKRTSQYMHQNYPEWKDRMQKLNNTLLQDQTAPATGPAQLDDLDYSLNTFTELKEEFEKLLHSKEIDQAEVLAMAATLKFPDNHEAWVLKATSDRLKGLFREAREAIHKSLLIEDSPEALIELFQVSQALGDEQEAKNISDMFDVAYPNYSAKFRELFPEVSG